MEHQKEYLKFWLDESIKNVDINTIYEIGEEVGWNSVNCFFPQEYYRMYACTEKLTSVKWLVKVLNKEGCRRKKISVIGPFLRFSHPHLSRLKEVFETVTSIYFVVEELAGGVLIDRFDSILQISNYYQHNERDAANYTRSTLEALEYLHHNDVVHRNMKVENIKFDSHPDTPVLKLDDFYFGDMIHEEVQAQIVGTDSIFCAPELLRGTRCYDKSADIWSVGVIAYILLAGIEPFFSHNEAGRFKRILKADYSLDCPEMETVSHNGKDFIRRMLMLKPSDRLSARQALKHPWVTGRAAPIEPLEGTLGRLRDFAYRRKIELAVDIVKVHNYDELKAMRSYLNLYKGDPAPPDDSFHDPNDACNSLLSPQTAAFYMNAVQVMNTSDGNKMAGDGGARDELEVPVDYLSKFICEKTEVKCEPRTPTESLLDMIEVIDGSLDRDPIPEAPDFMELVYQSGRKTAKKNKCRDEKEESETVLTNKESLSDMQKVLDDLNALFDQQCAGFDPRSLGIDQFTVDQPGQQDRVDESRTYEESPCKNRFGNMYFDMAAFMRKWGPPTYFKYDDKGALAFRIDHCGRDVFKCDYSARAPEFPMYVPKCLIPKPLPTMSEDYKVLQFRVDHCGRHEFKMDYSGRNPFIVVIPDDQAWDHQKLLQFRIDHGGRHKFKYDYSARNPFFDTDLTKIQFKVDHCGQFQLRLDHCAQHMSDYMVAGNYMDDNRQKKKRRTTDLFAKRNSFDQMEKLQFRYDHCGKFQFKSDYAMKNVLRSSNYQRIRTASMGSITAQDLQRFSSCTRDSCASVSRRGSAPSTKLAHEVSDSARASLSAAHHADHSSHPADDSANPRHSAAHPADHSANPRHSAAHPADHSANPRHSAAHPADHSANPEHSAAHPADHSANPRHSAAHPADHSANPRHSAAHPADHSANPRHSAGHPADHSANPRHSAAHPADHSAHPDDHSAHLTDHTTHPADHSAHPDDHSAHPDDHAAHHDDHSAHLTDHTTHPADHSAHPADHSAHPDDHSAHPDDKSAHNGH